MFFGFAPDVVLPFAEADDAGEDVPGVDPDPHVDLHAVFAPEKVVDVTDDLVVEVVVVT